MIKGEEREGRTDQKSGEGRTRVRDGGRAIRKERESEGDKRWTEG